MNIALFEDAGWRNLLPLTWLRPAWELRCGRDCLIDKVRAHAGAIGQVWARPELKDVLAARTQLVSSATEDWCLINGRALVTAELELPPAGVAWQSNAALVAVGVPSAEMPRLSSDLFLDPARLAEWLSQFRSQPPPAAVRLIEYPWDLVQANAGELRRQCRAGGAREGRLDPGAHLLNEREIHVARGARIKPGVVLDAEDGPIHIDEEALIEPNAVVQGPCYIGPRAIIRPTADIRQGTSVGPVCKIGGEIEGTVFQGYSNKQHDGFLGHSFVCPWVNLGADTVNSDLKNTYGPIRVAINGVGVESGLKFVGATIGDHAKTGIGTIIPTGGVLGVAANVFCRQPLPKFVPSFGWLTDDGLLGCRVEKVLAVARAAMARRGVELTAAEQWLLEHTAAAARQVEEAGWVL